MGKTISGFLESNVGPIRVRGLLTLLLCVANFFLAYGICVRYLMSGSSALFYVSLAVTVVLTLLLAFPNLETRDDAEAKDLID